MKKYKKAIVITLLSVLFITINILNFLKVYLELECKSDEIPYLIDFNYWTWTYIILFVFSIVQILKQMEYFKKKDKVIWYAIAFFISLIVTYIYLLYFSEGNRQIIEEHGGDVTFGFVINKWGGRSGRTVEYYFIVDNLKNNRSFPVNKWYYDEVEVGDTILIAHRHNCSAVSFILDIKPSKQTIGKVKDKVTYTEFIEWRDSKE
jgi:glucan phosphoethanolaminetransferase (alkaline phosphatase superfamily)